MFPAYISRLSLAGVFAASVLIPVSGYAVCSTPSGAAGDQIYNGTFNVMQYCNGIDWINMGGLSSNVSAAGSNSAIQFNTGNVLDADSSYFVWDKTNHRLGIGSTSPGVALDVVGAAAVSSTLAVTGNVTLSGTGNAVGTITSGTWHGTAIDLGTYASGTLQAAQFPALSGDISTSAGSLTTAIGSSKVTNAMLAGSIEASKLVGTDIATIGTVTSGTWHGTAIDLGNYSTGTLPYAQIPVASAANFQANTASKVLDTNDTWSAAAVTALTDAATVAVDLSTGLNFSVTLGGNRTLGNPTNTKVGQTGIIRVAQDGTGSRTLAYGSNYKWAGGTAGTLSTTASKVDYLWYFVYSSTEIFLTLTKDVR